MHRSISYKKIAAILFVFFVAVLKICGQNLNKANKYYAQRAYAQAIPIFEATLTKENNISTKSKLANCYRVLSKPEKALPLYDDIVKAGQANPKDKLYYAETLMSMSRYDEAKIWLKKFTAENPEDARGQLLFDNCDKIKNIKPYFKNVLIKPLVKKTDSDDNAPVFYHGSLVFASDRSQGFKLLKEKNPQTGRDFPTLYVTKPLSDTTYSKPQIFSRKLMELNKNTANASFTADETRVYYCKNAEEAAQNGNYNMQLYTAETSDFVHWRNVERLNFCSLEANYIYPAVSPDGNWLFYVMDKGEGRGGLDLFWSHKTKRGWSRPENLGTTVNTPTNECFPFFSRDNKLYFSSKGHTGFGGYDIFFTQFDSINKVWQTPVNCGTPINSAFDDISISFSDFDPLVGAFTSTRAGHGDDIYFFKLDADVKVFTPTKPEKTYPSGYSIDANERKKN